MKYHIKHTRGVLLKDGRAHGPWEEISTVEAGDDKTLALSKLKETFENEQPYSHGLERWGWDFFRTCDNYNARTRDVYQLVDDCGKEVAA